MSDSVVAEYFKEESLLTVSLGQDGLLGYFASNYSTILAMYEAIYTQEEETLEKKQEAYEELEELRETLGYYDAQLTSNGYLNDIEKGEYNETTLKIEENESRLEEEDVVFFRGEPLRMCAEYEFIDKLEGRFPGIMLAVLEIDHMIRRPISNWIGKSLSWITLPIKYVVGIIVRTSGLGVGGNLIYMLIDQYPEVIEQRMQPEVPTGRPVDYPDYKVEGFSIKEKKNETSMKLHKERKRDKDDE